MRPPAPLLPPHRVFFVLAALGGAAPVAVAVAMSMGLPAPAGDWPAGRWHAHEMVFGYFAAAFAGVLLTALPRWTGCAPLAPRTVLGLAAIWLVARFAFLLDGPGRLTFAHAALGSSALFVAALGLVAGRRILQARDRRNAIVPALLALLAAADLLSCIDRLPGDIGVCLGLACALGIAILMGGRVAPALTRHLGKSRGRERAVANPRWLERLVAAATALALTAWCLWPSAPATVPLLALAAAAHGARLLGWSGWTTVDRPSFLALHLGYAFLPAGFGLAALAIAFADARFADAGLHAWGTGVLGLMCGAVQASVIRRHGGRPLRVDHLSDAACGAFFLAALLRTLAPFLEIATATMLAAAIAWWAGQLALALSALRPPTAASSLPAEGRNQ